MLERIAALAAVGMADAIMFVLSPIDINVLLNVVMLLVAAGVAWPILRARRKDATITDLEKSLAAADRREHDLQKDLAGVERRANEATETCKRFETELAAANARYEEQSKYTAEGAVNDIKQTLSEHRQQIAERHELMLAQLQANRHVLESIAERLDRS